MKVTLVLVSLAFALRLVLEMENHSASSKLASSSVYYDLDEEDAMSRLQFNGVNLDGKGDKAILQVSENPTTGYLWTVDRSKCNESIVDILTSHE